MPLIEIIPPEYNVTHQIAYATSQNFTGKPVYKQARCFLHPEAAAALKKAIGYAAELGFTLKIFDAYRPPEAQFKLWEHTPDPNFLADPNKGSPHSRGVAIDLNLVDKDGLELDMGTPFDTFFAPIASWCDGYLATSKTKSPYPPRYHDIRRLGFLPE
ncbi:MAG: M15 family metallopeptidase [Rickettsiales bacterium]